MEFVNINLMIVVPTLKAFACLLIVVNLALVAA